MSILAIKDAIHAYMDSAAIPHSEFDADFAVKMLAAMMVSYHKYGAVNAAYPERFDALSDLRARAAKYRSSRDRQYLVDAANFAMIEAMTGDGYWGTNDDVSSIGRTSAETRQLRHETNAGDRIYKDRST